MNLREGMQRLALLLGVVGAILGGFVSYSELQSALGQRARHVKFEQLANSNVVKQVRTEPDWFAQNAPPYAAALSSGNVSMPFQQMTLEQFGQKIKSKYPEYADLSNADLATKVLAKYPQYISVITSPDVIQQWKAFDAKQREQAMAAMTPDQKLKLAVELGYKTPPTVSTVNRENIKTIHWTEDYGIESIETADGQTLYPTPAPAWWTYLLIAFLPIIGFFIPWSAVRAIGWVGAGFAESSK
jgi:hypothetical protein